MNELVSRQKRGMSNTWILGLARTKSLGSIWDTGLELRRKVGVGDSYKFGGPFKINLVYAAMRVHKNDSEEKLK